MNKDNLTPIEYILKLYLEMGTEDREKFIELLGQKFPEVTIAERRKKLVEFVNKAEILLPEQIAERQKQYEELHKKYYLITYGFLFPGSTSEIKQYWTYAIDKPPIDYLIELEDYRDKNTIPLYEHKDGKRIQTGEQNIYGEVLLFNVLELTKEQYDAYRKKINRFDP